MNDKIKKTVKKTAELLLSQKGVDEVRDRILASQYFIFNNPDDEDVKALRDGYIRFRKLPDAVCFSLLREILDRIEAKREPK